MAAKVNAFRMWLWQRHIRRMNACSTVAELLDRFGEPPHRSGTGQKCIWHYPLRAAGGTLFSIHVSIAANKPMAYLHVEPMPAGYRGGKWT